MLAMTTLIVSWVPVQGEREVGGSNLGPHLINPRVVLLCYMLTLVAMTTLIASWVTVQGERDVGF